MDAEFCHAHMVAVQESRKMGTADEVLLFNQSSKAPLKHCPRPKSVSANSSSFLQPGMETPRDIKP